MSNYYCPKCGGMDFFIAEKGPHKGLYCVRCGKWIKWLGKREYIKFHNMMSVKKKECEPIEYEGMVINAAEY